MLDNNNINQVKFIKDVFFGNISMEMKMTYEEVKIMIGEIFYFTNNNYRILIELYLDNYKKTQQEYYIDSVKDRIDELQNKLESIADFMSKKFDKTVEDEYYRTFDVCI